MLSDKRILIVEDEPLIALDLEACIKDKNGVVVDTVDCPSTALDLVAKGQIDGIILDLMLKGTSAKSLVETLLQHDVAIVIHSASADTTTIRGWPTIPVVAKPAPPEQVVSMLGALIAARSRG